MMAMRLERAAILAMAAGAAAALATSSPAQQTPAPAPAPAPACANDSGITLPPGFCATVFADNLGHVRHMAVAEDGTLYINSWGGRYFRNAPKRPEGGFLAALRDADGDGRAEIVERFGPSEAEGGTGGTGVALYKGGLFVEEGDRILRYALKPGRRVPAGAPAVVVSGLPMEGDHPMHPIAIDAAGNLFVNSGSASNTCEIANRQPGSKGHDPCAELETRGGIWRYSADRTGQVFSPAERYATGIRNAVGLTIDQGSKLYSTQHGRDQLSQNWPALYRPEQGPELPAEELMAPVAGSDFGWPFCYFDAFQHKRVLAPEYGGDGATAGRCADKAMPVATFPAHWAPNAVLIYRGSLFPAAYRGGAFLAFHGSWNRAPTPQDGYNVVFQPLIDGRASGPFVRFADGFAGAFKEPGRATYRPAGLAMGKDGALYISDDVRGRIWRVTYTGAADAPAAAARAPGASVTATATGTVPARTLPPGFTAAQVALGDAIYHGRERDGTCSGCHGSDGKGGPIGPALTGPDWLWGDGSVAALAKAIREGVAEPKKFTGAMPPKGGAPLSDADVDAVAAYVWTLGK